MRRIRIVGLCLVAVFALGAVGVASASAAPRPTYKTCRRVAKGAGKFAGKTCTQTGGNADYELGEWNEGKEASPRFKGTSGVFTLTSYIKGFGPVGSISCSKGKWAGVVSGPSQSTLTETLEKCKTSGEVCTSKGANSGNIVTNPLTATLITLEGGGVGVLIKAAAEGGTLAEFGCGAESESWSGSVDGVLSGDVGRFGKEQEDVFSTNASGENVINHEEGGTEGEDILLLESRGVGSFETGINNTWKSKGEAMEIVPG